MAGAGSNARPQMDLLPTPALAWSTGLHDPYRFCTLVLGGSPMSCWQVLELAPHSDARTIKRRYAELVKVFRPDEDPDAFQRLRDAYEQALAVSRFAAHEWIETPLASEIVSIASQTSSPAEPLPPSGDNPDGLDALMQNLSVSNLDDYLAAACASNGQVVFEQRLLEHCLSAREDASALAAWALAHLQWLTPWQQSPLPPARLEALTERLLAWHLAELDALVEAGEEAQAEACVQRFYRQDWMQAVDRGLTYTNAMVDWMLANNSVTTDFFTRVCKVFGWDERIERMPIAEWQRQALLKRPDVHWFSKRVTKLLAVTEPHNTEESAAWMLFQDLNVIQRRRLADSFIQLDWVACDHMQRVAGNQRAETMTALPLASNFDWQRYQHGQRWPGAYAWLVLLCILTFALLNSVPHSLQWTRSGGAGGAVAWLIESCMSGVFAALLVSGFHGAWNWLARRFTATDMALAERYLPPSVYAAGAGLLPLRNGVPCIALGVMAGALLATAADLPAWQVLAMTLLGVLLPCAYVLLQFFRPSLQTPKLAHWVEANAEGMVAHAMWVAGVIGLGLMLWFSKSA